MVLRERLNLVCLSGLGVLFGCLLAEFIGKIPGLIFFEICLVLVTFFVWPKNLFRLIAIFLVGFGFGIICWQNGFQKWNVSLDTNPTYLVTGYLSTDLIEKTNNQQAIITVTNLQQNDQKVLINPFKIVGYFPPNNILRYGNQISFLVKLREIKSTDSFDTLRYWRVRNVKYSAYIYNYKIIGYNYGHPISARLISIKNYLSNQVSQILPNNEGKLLLSLLFGSGGAMPKELSDQFRTLGISHLTAVSGYNLTIISLWPLLLAGLIPRQKAILLAIILVLLFVIFTGAPSSILRAGIMALVILLGQFRGRKPHTLLLIIFVASLMALANPFAVKDDAGFILSFLAFFGLIELAPLIYPLTKFLRFESLRQIFSQTCGAQIATLPYLLGAFGQLTLISPLSNLIILPLVPLLMGIGLVGVFFAAIPIHLTAEVCALTYYPMHGLIKLTELASHIPYASFSWTKGGLFPWYLAAVIFSWWSLSKRQMFRKSVGAVHEPPAGNS